MLALCIAVFCLLFFWLAWIKLCHQKWFVILLIRKRLGLKKNEKFRFCNQKSKDIYYFTDDALMKELWKGYDLHTRSGASLNWLLDDKCEIVKVDEEKEWGI